MALPVPPAPTTSTRTALWLSKPGGRVCSMRISVPFVAHKLRECLWQSDQRLQREWLAFSGLLAPQPVKATFVPGETAHVGMGAGAVVESLFPLGDRGNRCVIRPTH